MDGGGPWQSASPTSIWLETPSCVRRGATRTTRSWPSTSRLSPQDLEGLADASWWLSKIDESIAARQRAYTSYTEAGEELGGRSRAASGDRALPAGEPAVGGGWLGRAQRHARRTARGRRAGLPRDGRGHGHPVRRRHRGARARRGRAIGQRFGEPDLLAMALRTQGLVQIAAGRVSEGLPWMDEAMTSVVAGGLTILHRALCNLIAACLLEDVRRAGEWSEAARDGANDPVGVAVPGICRVNRAQVARLRGAWAEAEAEAATAVEELTP